MLSIFQECIFCGSTLPKERIGEGEHIIPKSIMGFWTSHDVCSECILYFGKQVDRLAIKHVRLIETLKTLDISDPEHLLEQIPWKGNCVTDAEEVPMVRRGNKFHIKVTQQEDFMECSDSVLEKVGKPWLWNKMRGNISCEKFDEEYNKFLREYVNIKPGETYHSHVFNHSFRKRQVHGIIPKEVIPEGFTRLLAKIAYTYLLYSVPKNHLLEIEEMGNLRDHARYGKPLKEWTINPLRYPEGRSPERFHSVTLFPDNRVSMLDIRLFGYFSWRTVIHTPSTIKIISKKFQQSLELIQLVLDFRDLSKRQKLIGLKPFGTDDYEWDYLDA